MELVEKDIRVFKETLRDHSRYDFSDYSFTSLRRRLTRIVLEYDMDVEELARGMANDPGFLERIVRKMTVNTTELFRDPDVWKKVRTGLLPELKKIPEVHIWHPGCSTGQEIYSMMMILAEQGILDRARIYGSDINVDSLEAARKGRYKYHFNQSYLENFDRVILNGSGEAHRSSRKHWKKYFSVDQTRDVIQMKEFLREKPVYKKMDLVKDPNPFSVKFEVIVCRNVIIYFNTDLQNRVLNLFYRNLKEGGILLLGIHESILGPFSEKFRKEGPFYRRRPT